MARVFTLNNFFLFLVYLLIVIIPAFIGFMYVMLDSVMMLIVLIIAMLALFAAASVSMMFKIEIHADFLVLVSIFHKTKIYFKNIGSLELAFPNEEYDFVKTSFSIRMKAGQTIKVPLWCAFKDRDKLESVLEKKTNIKIIKN